MTSKTLDKLVYMANQIATAFRMQEHEKAVEATWDHLWHFWDPRMRRALLDYLDAHPDGQWGDTTLSPICLEAIDRHREHLYPRQGASLA